VSKIIKVERGDFLYTNISAYVLNYMRRVE